MANSKIEVVEVAAAISKKLYNFSASKELAWAWNCNENIILYGAGGYGKSDAAMIFSELLFEKGLVSNPTPYVLAFGQGMTEEKLLGGMDIKKFQDEGEIIYNLKNAFVSSEVVIFEELWDAFPAVLLILKDILQSRCVRMGNQTMPISTKIVVACTNRSREEVVSDNSTAALLERFVFEKEVCWTSWEKDDYLSSFEVATASTIDNTMVAVAEIACNSSKGEYKISPRTAGKALKSAYCNGVESLIGFYGMGKAVKEVIYKMSELELDKANLDMIKTTMENLSLKVSSTSKSAMYWMKLYQELSSTKLAFRDANTDQKRSVEDKLGSLTSLALNKAKGLIVNPKPDTVYSKFLLDPNTQL